MVLVVAVVALSVSTLYYFGAPSGTVAVHADHGVFADEIELLQYSDLVVVARLDKDFSRYEPTVSYTSDGRLDAFYTVTDVQILKQLKGDVAGKTLPVIQGAAYIRLDPLKNQKDLVTSEGFFPMQAGKPYLLFLKVTDIGAYSIVALNQGKFNVDGADEQERSIEGKDSQFRDLKAKVLSSLKGMF